METEEPYSIRDDLSPEQRTADLRLSIDPGFVHRRKIQTLVGRTGMAHVDDAINRLPSVADWEREVRIDHIYKDALLLLCEAMGVPTLPALLAAGRGRLFCSTVSVEAAPEIYDNSTPRAVSRVRVPGVEQYKVELHYSGEHIAASTTRSQLFSGDDYIAVVAQYHTRRDNTLMFHPLLMGTPWLTKGDDPLPFDGPEWYGQDYFENFIEDIAEFANVRNVPAPGDFDLMRSITETAFKTCLAEILGDQPRPDWGGEMSDHYAAHVHLGPRRTTAAFLLKGPAGGSKFRPMALNHLGQNNDQI